MFEMTLSGANTVPNQSKVSLQAMPIEWAALCFTAFVSGGVFAITVLMQMTGLGGVPGGYLLPFLPGALIGGLRFFTHESRARVPFVTVVFLLLGGLLWTRSTELLDGLLLIVSVVVTMAISVLFNTRQRWTMAANYFVAGAILSSLFLVWEFVQSSRVRLGDYFYMGQRIIDPNLVGVLFSVAVIVQLTLLWNSDGFNRRSLILRLPALFWFLGLIVLTGSRGSLLTVVAAVGVFLLYGRLRMNRRLILILGVLMTSALSAYWTINGPPAVLSRFSTDSLSTVGGRFQIWMASFDRMNNWNAARAVFGEGTGSAPYAIGHTSPDLAPILFMDVYSGYAGGVPRVNAHSAYLEWLLTFGMIGAFVGAVLLFNAYANSRRSDSNLPGASGVSFLTIFLLTSFSLVAFRMVGVSIACGGVALGYIYSTSNLSLPQRDTRLIDE